MTDLIRSSATILATSAEAEAIEQILAGQAKNTRRAYESDWKDFVTFCRAWAFDALPATPQTLSHYLVNLSCHRKLAAATITRRLYAIKWVHRDHYLPSPTDNPTIRQQLRGIRRLIGTHQKAALPATLKVMKQLVATCDESPIGCRDRALLLIGFAGAFRRSELVALNMLDICMAPPNLTVCIERAKADQAGRGRAVGIIMGRSHLTCPVRALTAYLALRGDAAGAVFLSANRNRDLRPGSRLSGEDIPRIIKQRAAAAGMSEEEVAGLSGHSLRAGMVTEAAMRGLSEERIAQQTGHRSMETLRRYIRRATVFDQNLSAEIGL